MHVYWINQFLSVEVNNADSHKIAALGNWIACQYDHLLDSYERSPSNFRGEHLRDMQASIKYFSEETGITFTAMPVINFDPCCGTGFTDSDWNERTTDTREIDREPYAGGFTGGYEFD